MSQLLVNHPPTPSLMNIKPRIDKYSRYTCFDSGDKQQDGIFEPSPEDVGSEYKMVKVKNGKGGYTTKYTSFSEGSAKSASEPEIVGFNAFTQLHNSPHPTGSKYDYIPVGNVESTPNVSHDSNVAVASQKNASHYYRQGTFHTGKSDNDQSCFSLGSSVFQSNIKYTSELEPASTFVDNNCDTTMVERKKINDGKYSDSVLINHAVKKRRSIKDNFSSIVDKYTVDSIDFHKQFIRLTHVVQDGKLVLQESKIGLFSQFVEKIVCFKIDNVDDEICATEGLMTPDADKYLAYYLDQYLEETKKCVKTDLLHLSRVKKIQCPTQKLEALNERLSSYTPTKTPSATALFKLNKLLLKKLNSTKSIKSKRSIGFFKDFYRRTLSDVKGLKESVNFKPTYMDGQVIVTENGEYYDQKKNKALFDGIQISNKLEISHISHQKTSTRKNSKSGKLESDTESLIDSDNFQIPHNPKEKNKKVAKQKQTSKTKQKPKQNTDEVVKSPIRNGVKPIPMKNGKCAKKPTSSRKQNAIINNNNNTNMSAASSLRKMAESHQIPQATIYNEVISTIPNSHLNNLNQAVSNNGVDINRNLHDTARMNVDPFNGYRAPSFVQRLSHYSAPANAEPREIQRLCHYEENVEDDDPLKNSQQNSLNNDLSLPSSLPNSLQDYINVTPGSSDARRRSLSNQLPPQHAPNAYMHPEYLSGNLGKYHEFSNNQSSYVDRISTIQPQNNSNSLTSQQAQFYQMQQIRNRQAQQVQQRNYLAQLELQSQQNQRNLMTNMNPHYRANLAQASQRYNSNSSYLSHEPNPYRHPYDDSTKFNMQSNTQSHLPSQARLTSYGQSFSKYQQYENTQIARQKMYGQTLNRHDNPYSGNNGEDEPPHPDFQTSQYGRR